MLSKPRWIHRGLTSISRERIRPSFYRSPSERHDFPLSSICWRREPIRIFQLHRVGRLFCTQSHSPPKILQKHFSNHPRLTSKSKLRRTRNLSSLRQNPRSIVWFGRSFRRHPTRLIMQVPTHLLPSIYHSTICRHLRFSWRNPSFWIFQRHRRRAKTHPSFRWSKMEPPPKVFFAGSWKPITT